MNYGKIATTVFAGLAAYFLPFAGNAEASELDDYIAVATRASIDYSERCYLSQTDMKDFALSRVELANEQRGLSRIATDHSDLLGDAAKDVSSALPLLNKIYLSLRAENFEAIPLALFVNLMSQSAFRNDLYRYEKQTQNAAFKLVDYLRRRNDSAEAGGKFEIRLGDDSASVTNLSSRSLRHVLLSFVGTDIYGRMAHVVAYKDEWRTGSTARVWSGKGFNFGPVTDVKLEVLTFDRRYEVADYSFPGRLNEACEAACRGIELAVDKDQFESALTRADELSTIVQQRQISGFDDRLERVRSLSQKGLKLVPTREAWVASMAKSPRFSGDYRKGRTRAHVQCVIVHADDKSGDLRMRFYVMEGRKRQTFYGVGRIDIDPETGEVKAEIAKQSGFRKSVDELTLVRSGSGMRATDDEGGRITFRKV